MGFLFHHTIFIFSITMSHHYVATHEVMRSNFETNGTNLRWSVFMIEPWQWLNTIRTSKMYRVFYPLNNLIIEWLSEMNLIESSSFPQARFSWYYTWTYTCYTQILEWMRRVCHWIWLYGLSNWWLKTGIKHSLYWEVLSRA